MDPWDTVSNFILTHMVQNQNLGMWEKVTAAGMISVRSVCDSKCSWQTSNKKQELSLKIIEQENIAGVGANAHHVPVNSVGAEGALYLPQISTFLLWYRRLKGLELTDVSA